MALIQQHTTGIIIVVLLSSCGIVHTVENNEDDTTRGVTFVHNDTSSDNFTELVTSADNLLPADNSTQSATNNTNTATDIPDNSTSVPTPKKDLDTTTTTTQIPIHSDKTTQENDDNSDSSTQSSTKAADEIEKQSKGPGSGITDIDQDKTSRTKPISDITTPFAPVTFDTRWMDILFHTHHFEGQYVFNDVRYLFDFVVRYKHPDSPRTLVTNLYDADGAVLEFNGTSTDGHVIVFTLSKIYTPGVRFPLHQPLEITGSFTRSDQPYFTGNFTKPVNSSFTWFHMNKGLGTIETGETAGTKTAIVIIIPTSIAFLGICGTVAIICWASKKGYLRGRHKSYRLFTDAQVSYESEAETIHI